MRVIKMVATMALIVSLSGCLFPPPGGGWGGGHGGGPRGGFMAPGR